MSDVHNICEHWLTQGCKYMSEDECNEDCKKFTSHSDFLEYTSTHWKAVVLCKECALATCVKVDDNDIYFCKGEQTSPNGWCWKGRIK